jgi:protein-disulfide isomerase
MQMGMMTGNGRGGRRAAVGEAARRTAAALLAGTMLLAANLAPAAAQQSEADRLLQRAAQSRAKGPQTATVTVYEIADFQCPFCARFSTEIFPRIDSAYVRTGRVQWVFVNLPLPSHHNAWTAAEAALCAGAVGDRFWPLHSRLYGSQGEWAGQPDPSAAFSRFAREAGVPMDAWNACVAGDRVAPLILQDVIFAATSRVGGTPTFVINNAVTIVGMKSFEEWRDILERELRKE